MSKMQERITNTALVLFLLLVWYYPVLLSQTGIALLIAWAYGIIMARIVRTALQYAVLNWGVNRWGIIGFGLAMMLVGGSLMYLSWMYQAYVYIGVGWVLLYTGYDSTFSAYKKKIGNVVYEMVINIEYLVVALLALALFGGYLPASPIGLMNIEYHTLRGESLLFVAIVMLACRSAHDWWRYMFYRARTLFSRRS